MGIQTVNHTLIEMSKSGIHKSKASARDKRDQGQSDLSLLRCMEEVVPALPRNFPQIVFDMLRVMLLPSLKPESAATTDSAAHAADCAVRPDVCAAAHAVLRLHHRHRPPSRAEERAGRLVVVRDSKAWSVLDSDSRSDCTVVSPSTSHPPITTASINIHYSLTLSATSVDDALVGQLRVRFADAQIAGGH